MRRLYLVSTMLVTFYGPATAFDFTARSFGPIFDRDFSVDHVRIEDGCSKWDADGGLCTYGHSGDFTAGVQDTAAPNHQAQAVFFSWGTAPVDFASRPDALYKLVALLSPRLNEAKRREVVSVLAPGGKPEGRVIVDGVHYVMVRGVGGQPMLQAYDLHLPGDDTLVPGPDVTIRPDT